MRHVTYVGKSLLMEDDSADVLIRFAAAISAAGRGETVTLGAIGAEGNEVRVTFLVNAATVLAVESTTGDARPPDNHEEVAWMRDVMANIDSPPHAQPAESGYGLGYDELL